MKTKAQELKELMAETGPQYRTTMKELKNGGSSRHIRHMVENAIKAGKRFLDENDKGYANPKTESDRKKMEACINHLENVAKDIKGIKERLGHNIVDIVPDNVGGYDTQTHDTSVTKDYLR